jgi:hypothetical protein
MRNSTLWMLLFLGVPAFGASTMGKPAGSVAAEKPAPVHPVKPAQVYEILRLTGTDPMRRQMLDGMLPYMKQMMPYLPEDVAEDFQRSLGEADFQGAMVEAFQKRMSTEDAVRIIAFYKTDAGRRMIAVMPQILNEGQDAGAELGQRVLFAVIQRHKEQIDAAAKKYHEEHPETAAQK